MISRSKIWFVFQNMANTVWEKVVKELKLVKVVVPFRYRSHGDRSMKLFGGHKPCYNGQ